jgi:uncharacterized protein YaiI (UPF0178 family)
METPLTDIYVDADACPVKDEIVRVAERHAMTVYMVSNSGMRPINPLLVKNIMVAEGPDAADDWIAERCGAGDVVVTADIPLASRCVANRAHVIGPTGKPFTPDNMGAVLATRDLMAHLRETGEVTGGGRPFAKQDRSRFLQALETAIQAAKRAV